MKGVSKMLLVGLASSTFQGLAECSTHAPGHLQFCLSTLLFTRPTPPGIIQVGVHVPLTPTCTSPTLPPKVRKTNIKITCTKGTAKEIPN